MLIKLTNLLLILMIISSNLMGDSPAIPSDYSVVTKDKKSIFVMRTDDTWSSLDKKFLKEHPKSGLYDIKTNKLLWSINWYSYEVHLSNDGVYLIQPGPWASSSNYDENAVSFYKNGKLLKSYMVKQLVTDLNSVQHSISHYMWRKTTSFDQNSELYHITTYSNDEHTFDITTGEPVKIKSPINHLTKDEGAIKETSDYTTPIIIIALLLVILLLLLLKIFKKKESMK